MFKIYELRCLLKLILLVLLICEVLVHKYFSTFFSLSQQYYFCCSEFKSWRNFISEMAECQFGSCSLSPWALACITCTSNGTVETTRTWCCFNPNILLEVPCAPPARSYTAGKFFVFFCLSVLQCLLQKQIIVINNNLIFLFSSSKTMKDSTKALKII